MRVDEAEGRLRTMLAEAGVTPGPVTGGDVGTVVEVFRRFATVPVEGVAPAEEDGDGVLVQYGTWSSAGDRAFTTDLTRQWVEAGDDGAMWQLSCAVLWQPTSETEALGSDERWSFGRDLDPFLDAALASPGWSWAAASGATGRLVVGLDRV